MAILTSFESTLDPIDALPEALTSSARGEFDLIHAFTAPFATWGSGVVLGPGDDCAILEKDVQSDLCVTVDGAVDGVHFSCEDFCDEEIGHKVLAINLSDLAAMGAVPRWFLCSVEAPNDPRVLRRLSNIARSMAELAAQCGAVLVGGNFTHAANLAFHITAAGEVPKEGALRRNGAHVGDVVCVSGSLGGASIALNSFLRREANLLPDALRRRQCRPLPRIDFGQALRPLASAALDVSDGFLQDIGHICSESRVGMDIDASKIPIDPLIQQGFSGRKFSEEDQLCAALTGGEDYELAFTISPENLPRALDAARNCNIPITPVGQVVPGSGPRVVNCSKSLQKRLTNTSFGFDHFSARPTPLQKP